MAQPVPPHTPASIPLPTLTYVLAPSKDYNLRLPSATAPILRWLNSFALHGDYRSFFFPTSDAAPPEVTDSFSIASIQKETAGSLYNESQRGKPCGRFFKLGEAVYRCRDCGLDDTCCMCADCFNASDHSGHDITVSIHGSGCGCCDCGDPEAWKNFVNCSIHSPRQSSSPSIQIPDALRASIIETLRAAVHFMTRVLDASLDDFSPVSSEAAIRAQTSEEEKRQGITVGQGPWTSVLWNDEKHSYNQVISVVRRAIPDLTREDARQVAIRVDTHGKDTLMTGYDTAKLFRISQVLAQIDLIITTRPAQTAFDESVCGVVISWLKDLMHTQVGSDPDYLPKLVTDTLFSRVEGTSFNHLEILLRNEGKLWKQASSDLRELLVSLLRINTDVKIALGSSFANVYPELVNHYLLTDREPEDTVLGFSVQIFTVPSVALHIVQHQSLLSRIMSILYAYFTDQVDPERKRYIIPPNIVETDSVNPDTSPFRHKRYYHVFSDLYHLIATPSVKTVVSSSIDTLEDFVTFLGLFTDMNAVKRAVDQHVEWEPDTWVSAFNVILQVSKCCRMYGEAFEVANEQSLHDAFARIVGRVHKGTRKEQLLNGSPEAGGFNFSWQGLGPLRRYTIPFKVESEPVSFHHPQHWLASEIMKSMIRIVNPAQAINILRNSDNFSSAEINGSPLLPLVFYEAPLRVMALLAQIRCGLWVRNGFAMRAQLLHYREYNLRENTFDQDVFLLQTAIPFCASAETDLFLSLADRFSLLPWLCGDSDWRKLSPYDEAQSIAMSEELLYYIIILIGEPADIQSWNSQSRIQREIVHALCLGQCPYSEFVKRISARSEDDPSFDKVLGQVANFRRPDGSSDQGIYSLKEEYFSEVDPYYCRFSRNQREEASEVLLSKAKSRGEQKPVVIPKPLTVNQLESSANVEFLEAFINAAYTSPVLLQIVFAALMRNKFVKSPSNFSDTVIDLSLHILAKGLVQKPLEFAREIVLDRAWSENESLSSSILKLMCELEHKGRLGELVRNKATWCLDQLVGTLGDVVRNVRQSDASFVEEEPVDKEQENKNARMAKSRKEAIMKQFQDAQKSFAAKYDVFSELDDDDDHDDDDDDDDDATISGHVSYGSCIVCQEDLDASESFGSLAFVQSSRLIRSETSNKAMIEDSLAIPMSLNVDGRESLERSMSSAKVSGMSRRRQNGLHVSACGHLMHVRCHRTYVKSVERRHSEQRTRNHPENTERKEFLCPLCKSLGNLLLPVVPADGDVLLKKVDTPSLSFREWVVEAQQRLSTLPNLENADERMWAWQVDDPRTDISSRWENTDENDMLRDFLAVVWPISRETFSDSVNHYVSDDVLAYTIASVEIARRGQPSNYSEHSVKLSDATDQMLRGLFLTMRKLLKVMYSGYATRARDDIIMPLFSDLPVKNHLTPFLLCKPLSVLCEVASVSPYDLEYTVVLVVYAQLLRSFLSLPSIVSRVSMEDLSQMDKQLYLNQEEEEEVMELAKIAMTAWSEWLPPGKRAWSTVSATMGPRVIGKLLHTYMVPFLRRVEIVVGLRGESSISFGQKASQKGSDFTKLLAALNVPHPRDVLTANVPSHMTLDVDILKELMRRWFLRAYKYCASKPTPGSVSLQLAYQLEHPAIYCLAPIPDKLDELISSSLVMTCKRCNTSPEDPAICLLCGELVCHQNYCCLSREEDEPLYGECNTHMWSCGGSTGLYFIVKKNVVLYLHATKGTFGNPPYLDQHGEIDIGMRRQLRQFLHWPRYEEIRRQWVNQTIPTFVARKLEAMMDGGGWVTM